MNTMNRATTETTSGVIDKLRALLGDRLSTADAVRESHGHDESWHPTEMPDAVAFAESTEEVSAIVRVCHDAGVPMVPYGAGTSVEGHIQATHGGICVDVGGMNEVLEVHAEDLDCTVQPGVRRMQLNEHLRDTGLFFPIDPGADASIGGMTGTRASGTNAVRYGTMRENVMSLTVVLPNGEIIRTARRSRKSSAGYDLTRLFVGSEGTLGIITEITLRLYGIPENISSAVVPFETVEGAVDTTIYTIQSGIPIARIELLDDVQMDALNKYSKMDHPVKPTLFMEFHGTDAGVAEQIAMVKAIGDDLGAGEFQWSDKLEDRNRLWQARHDVAYACKAMRPGCEIWATDVCVPLSRLAECIAETRKDLEGVTIPAPMCGHVGDGNFHLAFVLDPNAPEELRQAEDLNERLVNRALAMDGTCTGEHGVGLGKQKYMRAEHGDALNVMRAVKAAIDPTNIMNPGKMLPAQN
ncbi:MAG: FAD-binding protein [Rhodospirillaceae bacterium]|nr:FAD-binding protein [Rhodospirillaceae bacterium]MBT4689926.1 FAD-binding protein [Rhodospirillaceae bacterium]MBT5081965.1 FAD-binding protein [Rhodospirillaceae bacterium]MBT5524827.1 FAD-binding protein [Rhodospirillaceae bacterium]MBT5881132.1 FAD-binding protein [Rhodospirillaceae bacterium]